MIAPVHRASIAPGGLRASGRVVLGRREYLLKDGNT
jgi:hypothetical protein